MQRDNIGDVDGCYGCGVCAVVCPKNIIKLELDSKGFYTPRIQEQANCIHCSLCVTVCAFLHEELAVQNSVKESFAAWSKDAVVRNSCSSGGVAFELGRGLMHQGYKVCAVRYDCNKERTEHYIADDEMGLKDSIGSKYIQSYTVDGFRSTIKGGKYLIVGTPCQIDSFRRMIRCKHIEENFILVDFFCHAVPSLLMWRNYIRAKRRKIISASWRSKLNGWHDSYVVALTTDRDERILGRKSEGDVFWRLFFGDYCSNPACSERCKYKYGCSSADIRLGDLWGKTYASDEMGTSAVIAFTEKGRDALYSTCCIFEPHPFEVVAEGQMRKNIQSAMLSGFVMWMLRRLNGCVPDKIWHLVFSMEKILRRLRKILKKN